MPRLPLGPFLLVAAVLAVAPAAHAQDSPERPECPRATVWAGPPADSTLERHRRAVDRLVERWAGLPPPPACPGAQAANVPTEVRQAWVVNHGWHDRTRLSRTVDAAGRLVSETVQTRTVGDWENDRRTRADYPDGGRVVTAETWVGGAWLGRARSSAFARPDGLPTVTRDESWSAETGRWRVDRHVTRDYDAQGHQTAVTVEREDETGLVPVERTLTETIGPVVTTRAQTWAGTGWRDTARTTLTADDSGRPLTEVDEVWQDGDWADRTRTLYTHDGTDEAQTQQWDGAGWADAYRTRLQTGGAHLVRTTEAWDGTGWVGLDRTERVRDAQGRPTLTTETAWDGGAYANDRRVRREYAGEALTLESHEVWDPPSLHWRFDLRTTLTLDAAGRPAQVEVLDYTSVTFVSSGSRATYAYDAQGRAVTRTDEAYDRAAGAWVNDTRVRFDYDEAAVARAAGPVRAATVAVGPNPAVGTATVRLAAPASVRLRADLLDALGRRVAPLWDGPVGPGETAIRVPTGALAPGVYLVRVEADGRVVSRVLTVAR